MKKILIIFAVLVFALISCGEAEAESAESETENSGSASTEKEETMKITITINGKEKLSATLAGNSSAKAFFALLEKGSVTVKMHDYGNFEKVGELPESLPKNDTEITTEPGDIILYQGNQITIYYDTNNWNFTRLGKIESVTQTVLKSILGEGDVTAVFEVEKEIN